MGFLLCNWMMMSLETAAVSRLSAQIFFFLMFSSVFILFEKKNKTICTRNTKKRPLSFRFIHDRMKDRRGEGGTKFSLANLRVQNERNSFVISPRMNIEMGGGDFRQVTITRNCTRVCLSADDETKHTHSTAVDPRNFSSLYLFFFRFNSFLRHTNFFVFVLLFYYFLSSI